MDRPDPSGLAFCTSTACGGGTTGSMNETGGSLHETHRPSRGGGSSGSGRGGGGRGASRYHGGGYNGGGHRATRYTTPRRAPARHTVSKARYRTPARPRSVTPLPPPPNPYLLCLGCVPFGAIAQGAALGAVGGVVGYLILQLILGEPITGNGILASAGIGMIFGATAPFIGGWLGRIFGPKAQPAPPRFITTSKGVTIDRAAVRKTISVQKQGRHVRGASQYGGGSYFKSAEDAQDVLDAFHNGDAQVLGVKGNDIVVRVNSVTGFNQNPRLGYIDQPTHVFFIKGTKSPSVVPYNPRWKP
ncbi:polymorphic toxin type 50 domain-containing protein [Acidipropionibacterium virtanenii]|uniref:Uncharacterized protein n=1 Tax=Acidipropionibacterium virtanenii TaxID=2057246 RepID=A0A344UQ95_9ACTN|nr:polymorphic toxin type 50 domain-containing protein [Acidipropionibacterium virtanenii]AXE37443.1 hypothetical protein JS278_00246 [Acidipropionibacterium virtanenii]